MLKMNLPETVVQFVVKTNRKSAFSAVNTFLNLDVARRLLGSSMRFRIREKRGFDCFLTWHGCFRLIV